MNPSESAPLKLLIRSVDVLISAVRITPDGCARSEWFSGVEMTL